VNGREDANAQYLALMDAIAVLRSETNRGFDGVHRRQDITNGRVQALEVESGKHYVQITALEDIEKVRHHATSQAMHAARLNPERRHDDMVGQDTKPITRRDVTILAWGTSASIAGTLAVLKFLGKLLP
jgi:hypothetical protein